jgi:D-arabinose 1-dehydrogenase-like Zn-dependent alcohol dehydrogenase
MTSSTPLPTQFQQWTTTQSGLDSLKLVTATMPVPKENEVLVKVHTVSLNYRDLEGSLPPASSLTPS